MNVSTSMSLLRHLSSASTALNTSMARLASGRRIVTAGDDAAGLVVSEKLRAQVGGWQVAARNAADGAAATATADLALGEVSTILGRMRDLAMHAASTGSTDPAGIAADQAEYDELAAELDSISSGTKFGSKALLDGSYTGQAFVVGPNGTDTVSVSLGASDAATLGVDGLDLSTGAAAAVATIDSAIDTVAGMRGSLGAAQSRFATAESVAGVIGGALSQAQSRITDVDYAAEMSALTAAQIRQESALAMLSNMHAVNASVLSLLRVR